MEPAAAFVSKVNHPPTPKAHKNIYQSFLEGRLADELIVVGLSRREAEDLQRKGVKQPRRKDFALRQACAVRSGH